MKTTHNGIPWLWNLLGLWLVVDGLGLHSPSQDPDLLGQSVVKNLNHQKSWSFRPNQDAVGRLVLLPRLGPTMGRRVVAWRSFFGPFRGTMDLRSIPGMGTKLLLNIEPFLDFDSR